LKVKWPWGRKTPSERLAELAMAVEAEKLAIAVLRAKIEDMIRNHEARIKMHEHDMAFVREYAVSGLKENNLIAARKLMDIGGRDLRIAVEHSLDHEATAKRLEKEMADQIASRFKCLSAPSGGEATS